MGQCDDWYFEPVALALLENGKSYRKLIEKQKLSGYTTDLKNIGLVLVYSVNMWYLES